MTWGVEMVVAAVVLIVGIAVLVTGVTGLRARLPRNRFIGVRTPATMRDDEAFALGNQVAAPGTTASGAVLALTGASTPLLGSALVLVIGLVGGVGLLLAGGLGYAVLSYPAFLLLTRGSWQAALFGLLMLVLCHAPILGTTTATLPALFPAQVRGTGVAVGYNASFAVFGGTAPLLATSLVEGSGNLLAPAAYLAGAGLLSAIPVVATPESARSPLPAADGGSLPGPCTASSDTDSTEEHEC